MINYKIVPSPLDHEWHILLTFTKHDDFPIEISLPNWTPGSYLIRDFSRHITSIDASCNGVPVRLDQIAKKLLACRLLTRRVANPLHSVCIRFVCSRFFPVDGTRFFDGACMF